MDATLRTVLWQQFGAAIDMLENAVTACPDRLWADRARAPEFWYVAYHTLFFLDFYLSETSEGFMPPSPFTLTELDPSGMMPDRVYSKGELGAYLQYGREKCRTAIVGLDEETAHERRRLGSLEGTVLEIHIYNMRHVQHHAAQLNLMLRQATDSAPRWVARAAGTLGG